MQHENMGGGVEMKDRWHKGRKVYIKKYIYIKQKIWNQKMNKKMKQMKLLTIWTDIIVKQQKKHERLRTSDRNKQTIKNRKKKKSSRTWSPSLPVDASLATGDASPASPASFDALFPLEPGVFAPPRCFPLLLLFFFCKNFQTKTRATTNLRTARYFWGQPTYL